MKRAVVCLLVLLLQLATAHAREQGEPDVSSDEWTGTVEQKLWGLMNVWAEAKFTFPSFDKIPDLDWDAKVQEYIPRVIAAEDVDSYYRVLMELAALLKDGHTSIVPPWGHLKPGYDIPAVEVQVVDDRFFIARVGETDEIQTQRVYPGLEILEMGENVPVSEYFKENILRYYSRGSKQADEAISVVYLLYGPKDGLVRLKVRDLDGTVRNVILTRNSTCKDGRPFLYRFVKWNLVDPSIESRMLPDNILYVKIPHFNEAELEEEFRDVVDALDLPATEGMVIDVRYNLGGNSSICEGIISCLIDQPVPTPTWKYPHYIGAYRAWDREAVWSETSHTTEPRAGKRYLGPLVVLIGPATSSTGEDFALPLHYSGRAVLVGQKTAGSSGNPIRVPLPGGGYFRVATFKATYPDGREYVGIGIEPDVEVRPSQRDIRDGYDRTLDKGVEVVKNWESFVKKQ